MKSELCTVRNFNTMFAKLLMGVRSEVPMVGKLKIVFIRLPEKVLNAPLL